MSLIEDYILTPFLNLFPDAYCEVLEQISAMKEGRVPCGKEQITQLSTKIFSTTPKIPYLFYTENFLAIEQLLEALPSLTIEQSPQDFDDCLTRVNYLFLNICSARTRARFFNVNNNCRYSFERGKFIASVTYASHDDSKGSYTIAAICRIYHLRELRLFCRKENFQPLAFLHHLQKLSISSSQLDSLEGTLKKLTSLRVLNLCSNHWETTQEKINTLINDEISQMTHLTDINLSVDYPTNTVTFEGVSTLTNLTTLNLSRNSLTKLPDFSNLTNLTTLILSYNPLKIFPPFIGQLTRLQTLQLQGGPKTQGDLTSLPPQIGNLTNLQTLELQNNQITALPQEFCNLTSLQRLGLQDNQIAVLPDEFGTLTSLQHLNLEYNRLCVLPREFGALTRLRVLNLEHNNLFHPFVAHFFELEQLEILRLTHNRLRHIPPQVGQLTRLTTLFLGNNWLTKLPAEINQLVGLTSLEFQSNQLRSLPSLNQLTNLKWLNISHNRITRVSEEFIQSTKASGCAVHCPESKVTAGYLYRR